MNRYAGIALNIAAVFLMLMAVLVDSPMLFYMATAVLVTLFASRIQAWLAIRYLRFERYSAPAVKVGEPVTVEIIVWSERKLKRPLVTIEDHLPINLKTMDRTESLPVAPSFDQPIRTKYSFRPTRRGKYSWNKLTVSGTDALGLVTMKKTYEVDPAELTVYPAPLPIHAEIQPLLGWGASDIDSGKRQGAGLEPRGTREFVQGDPLRYIHWRSSARKQNLMVKEFESGSGVALNLVLQRSQGSEIGNDETSTFELMCSHAMYLAKEYVQKGASVVFPTLENPESVASIHPEARERDVRNLLTEVMPDQPVNLSAEIQTLRTQMPEGSTLVILMSEQDPDLIHTITGWTDARLVCIVYDAREFATTGITTGYNRANEPAYIDQLEQAGAIVIPVSRKEQTTI